MLISSTSLSRVQPAPLTAATAVAPSGSAESSTPAVVVTLSQNAREVLAQGTAPPDPAPDPAQALRDQLTQAAAVLNDTSGSATTDDQFEAFKLISQTLLHGPAVNGESDPNLQYASALVDSPFAQHLNQVFGYMASQNTITSSAAPFAQRAEVDARVLAAFDGMTQADQQLYVSAQAFHTETTYELPWVHQSGVVIQSPEDFHANMQAQIQVDQALGQAIEDPRYAASTVWNGHVQNDADARVLALGKLAAAAGDQQMMDLTDLRYYRNAVDWTQKAAAYFEKYGPPPALSPAGEAAANVAPSPFIPQSTAPNPDTQRVLNAIATLNDSKASIDDKMAALDVRPPKNSAGSAWVLAWMSERSAFSKAVDNAGSGLMNQMMSVGRHAQAAADDVPPNGAQLTLGYLDSRSDDDQRLIARAYGYSDVSAWKADLLSQAAAFTAQYGDSGSEAAEGASRAQSAPKADDGTATALKTLKQVSASQKQFVEAERARRMGDESKATGIDAADTQATTNADPSSAKALETLRQIIDNLQSVADAERARRAGEAPKPPLRASYA
jgi:hypothetical protein